jgi:hypothetical protein
MKRKRNCGDYSHQPEGVLVSDCDSAKNSNNIKIPFSKRNFLWRSHGGENKNVFANTMFYNQFIIWEYSQIFSRHALHTTCKIFY